MSRSRAQRRVPEPQDALATLPAFRRSLPHCEETECAVLGAFLLAPSYLGTVGEELHPGCFYLERHREVFEAMAEVGPADLDLRTLQSRLEDRGSFER
ncbi:MAG: DnaB-like helicase N-terminal domain-containing protein, partial [Acidobacteriota bacterium]